MNMVAETIETLDLDTLTLDHAPSVEVLHALEPNESLLCNPKNSTLSRHQEETKVFDAVFRLRKDETGTYLLHEMMLGKERRLLYQTKNLTSMFGAALAHVEEKIALHVKYKSKLPDVPLEYRWIKVKHGE